MGSTRPFHVQPNLWDINMIASRNEETPAVHAPFYSVFMCVSSYETIQLPDIRDIAVHGF